MTQIKLTFLDAHGSTPSKQSHREPDRDQNGPDNRDREKGRHGNQIREPGSFLGFRTRDLGIDHRQLHFCFHEATPDFTCTHNAVVFVLFLVKRCRVTRCHRHHRLIAEP
jgi:hypothetical protein